VCPDANIANGLYTEPGLLGRFMQNVYAPFIANPGVQAVVLALFLGMFFTSIALLPSLSIGLDQKVVMPRDSYLQDYIDNVTAHIRVGPPVYFIVKDYNYSIGSNETDLLCSVNECNSNSLLNEVSKAALTPETSYIARPASSWLDDFLVWLSPDSYGCCQKFPDGSYCSSNDKPSCCLGGDGSCALNSTCNDCTACLFRGDLLQGRPSTNQFHDKLPWFLKATPTADCTKGGYGAYLNSLDLNGYEDGVIKASEFHSHHTALNTQVDI
jgi:Niemann-Pick C1 protein